MQYTYMSFRKASLFSAFLCCFNANNYQHNFCRQCTFIVFILQQLHVFTKRHFHQYFSYIVVVNFIGGGNQSTRRKLLTAASHRRYWSMCARRVSGIIIIRYAHNEIKTWKAKQLKDKLKGLKNDNQSGLRSPMSLRFDLDFWCFNATFSNISAISRRPVLEVEETGVPGENHWPWASNW